jgi:hypothetical protein
MLEIPARSKFFDFLTDDVAYKEREERDDAEPCDVHPGDNPFVDVNEKARRLKGRNIPAVVFSIGTREGLFWMPKERFYRLTKEKDIGKLTTTPFQP